MAQKSVIYMTYDNDERCTEILKYIGDAGIMVKARDLKKDPMSEIELGRLFGHVPFNHFLNQASPSYQEAKLDQGLPERQEMLQMIAKDPTLLRRPIISTSRMFVVGCDKKKIAEMLQINRNGTVSPDTQHKSGPRVSRHMVSSAGK